MPPRSRARLPVRCGDGRRSSAICSPAGTRSARRSQHRRCSAATTSCSVSVWRPAPQSATCCDGRGRHRTSGWFAPRTTPSHSLTRQRPAPKVASPKGLLPSSQEASMTVWLTALALCLALLPMTAAAAPAGKAIIAQGVDPTTLDMANQSESPASNVGRQIFDTLYERDQSLKIVPALATEMPKLVAPTTWEIKLRKGVKFHNGEDFNADSAKFSLERLAQGQGKLRGATFFAPMDRVEIVDPFTIRVHTKKPWPTMVSVLGFVQAGMIPPKAYADKDTTFLTRNPIGTGPYKFVRWAKDEEIVLEATPNYWRGAA